jgi:hypothetical protein
MTSRSEFQRHGAAVAGMSRRSVLAAATVFPLTLWSKQAVPNASKGPVAIDSVADFDEETWAALLKNGPRPAAYVFTTTYCSTCPDAFNQLHRFITKAGQKVELVAVVMDVPASRALAHVHYFAGATQLYAFEGFAPAIRQSVDPKWPNVTPYVVLLGRNGSVQRSIGPPEAAMLKKWLA